MLLYKYCGRSAWAPNPKPQNPQTPKPKTENEKRKTETLNPSAPTPAVFRLLKALGWAFAFALAPDPRFVNIANPPDPKPGPPDPKPAPSIFQTSEPALGPTPIL